MQPADALRELLESAAEAGARRALQLAAEQAPGALVAISAAPVSRRALLAAAKRGEIRIHRRGKAGFVDRAELEAWITRSPRSAPKPIDPIGEIIELNAGRRRARPSGSAG